MRPGAMRRRLALRVTPETQDVLQPHNVSARFAAAGAPSVTTCAMSVALGPPRPAAPAAAAARCPGPSATPRSAAAPAAGGPAGGSCRCVALP